MKKWCSKFSVISHEDWLIWCSWAKFFSPSFVIVVGKVQFCTNKGGIIIRNPIDQERKGLMPSICIFYLFLPWFSCDSLLPPHFLLFLLILRGHSFNLNALCLRQMIDFHKVPTLLPLRTNISFGVKVPKSAVRGNDWFQCEKLVVSNNIPCSH